MRISIGRSVSTSVTPSPRVLETASMFGLGVDEAHRVDIVPSMHIDLPIPGPGVVFVTGPSGGGKSTVLGLIGEACTERGEQVLRFDDLPSLPEVPLVDVFDRPIEQATSFLAMVGLSDAFVMLRKPSELSDGQRYRLLLAQAIVAAGDQRCVVVADEFGAMLDRLTASIIARSVRRWTRRSSCTFICATTHDDLLKPLEPDVLIYKGLGDAIQVIERPRDSGDVSDAGDAGEAAQADEAPDLSDAREVRTDCCFGHSSFRDLAKSHHEDGGDISRHSRAKMATVGCRLSRLSWLPGTLAIEPATARDYAVLASFHYRSAKPGAVTSAFRIVHRASTVVGRFVHRRSELAIVGVLLRTLPHLACALRDVATGQRYGNSTSRSSAMLLNREMRTIARVVIHPQWRGVGLAVDLVKHALANPEPGIVYTEALAAMGRVHPFFDKAGMTRYERPPRPEHARLLDALHHLGIEPFMLASPRLLRAELEDDACTWQLLLRELHRWHRSGARRSRHSQPDVTVDHLLAAARDQLLTLPVYYLYRHTSE